MFRRYFSPASLLPVFLLFSLYLAAIAFRPLIPIDETRYMSAAWEMHVRGDWLAPLTINFEPYHHKPPLLFWMINAGWSVFGVSRWAGLIPIVLSSLSFIYLTQILAKKLFNGQRFESLPYLVLGSVPFLIYNTLVMFDITLSVFVLLSFIALLSYAKKRTLIPLIGMALAMGLGVLTKGPVAWLYVIFPVLLAPFWLIEKQNWRSWYGGCALAFFLSTIPVLLWLIPVLKASSPDFAFWLVWEQTAGRISGNMGSAHHRPIYFYLPLLPVLFLPWVFFPSFWRGMMRAKQLLSGNAGIRFLACWVFPVIVCFSLIGGKQPHYLVPLLPGILIFVGFTIQEKMKTIRIVSCVMISFVILGQVIASQTVFNKYNLQPIADYVSAHNDKDWAFIRKYQGELTFLGRLHRSIDNEEHKTIQDWFQKHPDGLAVIRYNKPEEVKDLNVIFSMPYRSKKIGIFTSHLSKMASDDS